MRKKIYFMSTLLLCIMFCLGCGNQINYEDNNRADSNDAAMNIVEPKEIEGEMPGSEIEEEKPADDILISEDSEEAKYLKAMTSENRDADNLPKRYRRRRHSVVIKEDIRPSDDAFEQTVNDWKREKEDGWLDENSLEVYVMFYTRNKEVKNICAQLDGTWDRERSRRSGDIRCIMIHVEDSIEAAIEARNMEGVLDARPYVYGHAAD